jgi:hypothetical protein
VHRHLLKPKLVRGFESGMSTDDHPFGIHNNRLSEPELLDATGNSIDRIIIDARVVRIGFDVRYGSDFNLHFRFLNMRLM